MVFEVLHRALLRETQQRVQGVRGQVIDDELELRPTNLVQLVTPDRQRLDRPADLDQMVSPSQAQIRFRGQLLKQLGVEVVELGKSFPNFKKLAGTLPDNSSALSYSASVPSVIFSSDGIRCGRICWRV